MSRGAVVTGASSGIGRATAVALAEDGWIVAAVGRSAASLEAAFASPPLPPATRARLLLCGSAAHDLSTDAGCRAAAAAAEAALAAAGARTALLVNNAGGGQLGARLDAADAAAAGAGGGLAVFDATMALDLRAPWLLTALLAPGMAAAWPDGSAAIVNVSSVCAQRPLAGLGAYCVAKAGVEMLTKVAALEFAGRLRVNCVAPATIATDFHEHAGMSAATAAAYYAASAATHPVGRVGAPADIANLILFLADSKTSGFMTGTVVNCDGGRLLAMPTGGQLTGAALAR